MPDITRFPALLGALAVLAASTACAQDWLRSTGPLHVGGDLSELCMVPPQRGNAVTGDVITNDGNSALTIEDLALVDADNLELVGSYLFPMDGNDDFVIGASSTKPEEPRQRAAWKTVQRPQGYELAAHTQASIAVAVATTTDDNGTAEAIRVTYSVDGRQYVADTTTTIELSVTSCF